MASRAAGVSGVRRISYCHPGEASVLSPHGGRCGPVPAAAPCRPRARHTALLPSPTSPSGAGPSSYPMSLSTRGTVGLSHGLPEATLIHGALILET